MKYQLFIFGTTGGSVEEAVMKPSGRLHVTCALALMTAAVLGARGGEDETPPVIKRVETIQSTTEQSGINAIAQRGALITLDVTERPLKQVLDYLSTISNVNIRVVKEKDNKIPVTFRLENVTYRA